MNLYVRIKEIQEHIENVVENEEAKKILEKYLEILKFIAVIEEIKKKSLSL